MKKTKRGFNTKPKKLEQASNDTFNVTHDDGSVYTVKVDPKKAKMGSSRLGITMSECPACGSKWHQDCSNEQEN